MISSLKVFRQIQASTRKESFDPDPNERERLEAEGCTIMEERITTSDGTTVVKHY